MAVLSSLLSALRSCCATFPDRRTGANRRYAMTDIGLSAFAVCFMQSPSFLAHQRQLARGQGRSNCHTLFGVERIPSDNHVRALLDPVPPEQLFAAFDAVVAPLERTGGLAAFRRPSGHVLIALDGTEYFRSAKIHCRRCSQRARGRSGQAEWFHTLLAATLVAPGHDRVVPLPPEFVAPQDGHTEQDCESRAVRRWLAKHGPGLARLAPVYLGDDLFACQPICQAVRAVDGHFLFVAKPASHPTLTEYLTGVELPRHEVVHKGGRTRSVHRYRWLEEVPLRDGADAMAVNWLQIEILDGAGELTYRNSFVTDLPVSAATVAELAACGRARWKIENASFNVLKTKGYHLEHNFGHGRRHLAAVLATLNLLAFACHTACELADTLWRTAFGAAGARQRFFAHLRVLTVYLVFPTWEILLTTLVTGRPPPAGRLTTPAAGPS
jgi:hypothetical protein